MLRTTANLHAVHRKGRIAARQAVRIMIYLIIHRPRKENVMENSHVSALSAKHAGLDARIKAESSRPMPDAILVASLKKQKLRLKEEISAQH
jgi:hypothetical protein